MDWIPGPKPVVHEVLPNTAEALQNAGATPDELALNEQLAYAYKTGIKLRKLPIKVAQNEYTKLSSYAKEDINALFGNDPYLQGGPSFASQIGNVAKNVGAFLLSPLLYTYSKISPTYSKIINTPVRAGFETVVQKKPLFSTGTWSEAYSGKDIYNPKDVERINKTYGPAIAAVAMGLVAGKTPQEIMQDYSHGEAWDPKLGEALAMSLDKPKEFQKIIDDVKLSRFNPGNALIRDSTNYGEATIPHTGGAIVAHNKFSIMSQQNAAQRQGKKYDPTVDYEPEDVKALMAASGVINGVYQLIIDPLTYITGGGSKASQGINLARSVTKAAEEGNLGLRVDQLFKKKKIFNLWDNTIGPSVQKIVDAKTDTELAKAYEDFKFSVPGYNNRDIIKLLVKGNGPNKPIVNAQEAQRFFSDFENTHMLLNGRVDGTDFFRSGILTSRNNRIIDQGFARTIDAVFNPSLKNIDTQEAIAAAEKQKLSNWEILSKVGPTEDQGINMDVLSLNAIAKDISKTQKMSYKLGNALARSPQGGFILWGNEAEKTINNFINVARLVIPRDQAKILAEQFKTAPVNQQIATVRNLYFAYMQKMGIEGNPKGKEYIDEVLNKITNSEHGMGSSGITEVPSHFLGIVGKDTVKYMDDVPLLAKSGAPQPSMLTNAIAPLNFAKINELRDFKETHPFLNSIDKVLRSQFLKKYTNFWAVGTLLPRVGERSALDETFMYTWNQPLQDVISFVMGGGRKEGKVLTAVASTRDSVGPFKALYNDIFKKGGPEKYLTMQERSDIIEQLAEELSEKYRRTIPTAEVASYLKREAITSRVWDVYFGNLPKTFQGNREAIINAIKYNPHFLNGATNSLTARTGLTGSSAVDDIRDIMFEPSIIDKALKEVGEKTGYKGLKSGKAFYNIPKKELERDITKKLPESEIPFWYQADQETKDIYLQKFIALSHLDNFGLHFSYNSIPLDFGKGHDKAFIFNPVPAFFKNNALKNKLDIRRATHSLLEDVGVKEDSINGITREIINPDRLNSFNSMFVDTLSLEQKGLDAIQIARVHIETMLTDMYVTFHGDSGYNQELFNRIKEAYTKTFKDSPKKVSDPIRWKTAVNSIEFNEFEKLTVNKHPTKGGINTRIEYPDLPSFKEDNIVRRGVDWSFDAMDRQINGLFRQPALIITYSRIYNQNKPFIELMRNRTLSNLFDDAMEKGRMPSPKGMQWMEEKATNIAEKWGTEISMSEATDTILKFADNPNIRSNLSISLSTLGRFYRANEDFARRANRMTKHQPLTAFYRMRLAHTALSANGSVYTDSNDNEYIVAPTDSILFAPIASVLGAFYSGRTDTYKSAQFDEIKLKLSLLNPSLSNDAAEPMLSGPASAISVWGLSHLFGAFGSAFNSSETVKVGNIFDSILVGQQSSSNPEPWKALVPLAVSNLYDMISWSDTKREFITAAQSAINYLTANNQGLPSNPTIEQRKSFLQNVKVAVHSILFMRAFLGLVSPITPSLQDSKGLPSYYKKIGVTGLRPEFFEILSGIEKTYPDIQDPYTLATSIFIGKNPGKSVYMTSKNNKTYKVLLESNNQVKDWAIKNTDWVKDYGDAALVFSPKIGEFNSGVYAWLQSQDMVTLPSIDEYFTRAQVAVDKQRYFDISNKEKEDLTNNLNLSNRQRIIKEAEQNRAGILASNPYLKKELSDPIGTTKSEAEIIYNNLKELISKKNAPISREDRVQMNAAIEVMDGFISTVTDPEFKGLSNFQQVKQDLRQKTEDSIQNIAKLNPAVKQAYQYIFNSIMNTYVPEKYAVLGGK